MEGPMVSIILPVYNAKNHIARCIESIRAQTWQNFELIILNDGSGDVSLTVCEMYEKVDSRILLVDKDNSGVSDTRNLGLRLARGKYVQFVDSDDYLDPDYTENLVRAAEDNAADLVIAPYKMTIPRNMTADRRLRDTIAPHAGDKKAEEQPEIRIYGFLPAGVMNKEQFALHLMDKPASFYYGVLWNKLYRRDLLVDGNVQFISEVHWSEDLIFNLQYIRYADVFCSIDTPGYYYVQNPQSICHTKINAAAIVQTKATVFPYYKELYERLGLYEENKAAIHKYLVGMSESTFATTPLQKTFSEVREILDADKVIPALAEGRTIDAPEA